MNKPIERIRLELDAKEAFIRIELADNAERIERALRGDLGEHRNGMMFPLADEFISARNQRANLKGSLCEITAARKYLAIEEGDR